MKPIRESVLMRTCAASDIQCSGGVLTIAGLPTSTKKRAITSIKQVKYRAEVVQVVTVGGTAYTPTGSTKYTILIGDPNRQYAGAASYLKPYSYTTPLNITDLGATAALQREAIHAALVTKINADASNYVLAASLGTGTGLTITDDAGYFPPFRQGMTNRKGASTVLPEPNRDGSGFAETNVSTTTAAVYAFGVGADLVYGQPILDFMFGNLIQGNLDVPVQTAAGLPAVSGQKYDGFVIESLYDNAPAHNVTGQYALVPKIQTVFVDNGAGTDTTNAAAYALFEKEMFRHIADNFNLDKSSIVEFFDNRPMFSGTGAAGIPTGSDGDINTLITKASHLPYYLKGASTQIFPLWDATNGSGLILDLDNAAEGLEIAGQPLGTADQEFVVGKTPFSLYYKGKITDASQANPFYVGFRKKAAFNTAISGYTDYAALGFNASAATQTIKTLTVLASAAEVATSTTKTWADGETHTLELRVDINGAVKFYVDAVDVTSVQASAYSFTSGITVIPFVRAIGTGGGAPTNTANALIVLGSNTWRS